MVSRNQSTKPYLRSPFPKNDRYWKDPKTGIYIPKGEKENIEWRANLLNNAEHDIILQRDLMAACEQSLLLWVNAFAWTFHQFDVDETGRRIEAKNQHMPFISWDVQDDLFCAFEDHLKKGEDILIDKARDMGASWSCIDFMHWLWLFRKDAQLLEMSRTEDYVDLTGNMKATFQRHDYINKWLPYWMLPPDVLFGDKNRNKKHMANVLNGACIDGESTTKHAGSGDRRLVLLLDEFAKVEHGTLMRSATRDVALMRIINSTPAGPGTEYSRWKNSGQIRVFILPWHEHPEKGKDRYIATNEDGSHTIRSPWYDHEETVRSPKEMAKEINRQDLESGSLFFTKSSLDKYSSLFVREPVCRKHVNFRARTANDMLPMIIRRRDYGSIITSNGKNGPLRIWCDLLMGRPDQTKTYIFGIDISKGQGASESVISVKCKETGEKIAEWRDANTPPHDFARITIALAIWCGGRKPRCLPFIRWEKNGPGLDFGKLIVKDFKYPYFHRTTTTGKVANQKTDKYGWHSSRDTKEELLSALDRVYAHGGYINHSKKGVDQAGMYIYYDGGGIGPAFLVEESESSRKNHGDIVIADALTVDNSELGKSPKPESPKAPYNSCAARRNAVMRKRKNLKKKGWRKPYDFGGKNA